MLLYPYFVPIVVGSSWLVLSTLLLTNHCPQLAAIVIQMIKELNNQKFLVPR
jgi:hypothetical protein